MSTKLEGIHFVTVPAIEGLSKAGNRRRRKPTLAELEERQVLTERVAADSAKRRAQGEPWTRVKPPCDEHPVWEAGFEEPRPVRTFRTRPDRATGRSVCAYIDAVEADVERNREPLPANFYRRALAAEIEGRQGEKRARKPKRTRTVKRNGQVVAIRPATPIASPPRPVTDPPADVFRMFRRELIALGTPEAVAELERRKAKRTRKRAERVAA